ncbi:MAG: LemA family protein, partial [Aquificaceae bacterium]|nr:LemA family protein [Aquificaceae bacterium]
KKNAVHNALSSVDVYLKQRYDLIPSLVSSVKQYMQHERELLDQLRASENFLHLQKTLKRDRGAHIRRKKGIQLCGHRLQQRP